MNKLAKNETAKKRRTNRRVTVHENVMSLMEECFEFLCKIKKETSVKFFYKGIMDNLRRGGSLLFQVHVFEKIFEPRVLLV